MNIVTNEVVDLSKYGKTSTCVLRKIHVQINDTHNRIASMIYTLSDTSWINHIPKVSKKRSYEAKAKNSIDILVNNILSTVTSKVTSEAGEYVISLTAQDTLESSHSHVKFPIPELWKEQKKGNPGFDFHTESPTELLFYGEAKFKSSGSPYNDAMEQIGEFIHPDLEKHIQEVADLEELGASENSILNILNNEIGLVAAFSLNAQNIELIFNNAIYSEFIDNLLSNSNELFLIGIEICS